MEHPEKFKEYQDLETPDMLDLCYEHVIMRTPAKALDKIISAARRVEQEPVCGKVERNIERE